MELTATVTEHIVASTYEDLTPEIIEATKSCILDTLGVMLPPTTLGSSQMRMHDLVKTLGGRPESTIVGFGGKTSAPLAALLNGSLTHALDYDDTADEVPHHATASTLPTALALAERKGGVTGKDLITAIALADDLSIRIASGPHGSVTMDYPFFPISMFGLWGSTIAGSKILGLSLDQVRNAFGLALHQASGVTDAVFSTESNLRSYRDGFTNQSGVLASLMAECGVEAVRSNSLEIFFRTFYRDDYSSKRILEGLGETNQVASLSLKPWPCCREIHGHIEGALTLMGGGEISSNDIEEVLLTVGRFGKDHLCEPLAEKRAPEFSINAKLSLPFVIAMALTRKHVQIGDFSPESLLDPDVLRMADKVKYVYEPDFVVTPMETPAKITLRTKDGRRYEHVVNTLLGSPDKPLDRQKLEEKFLDCAQFSASSMSDTRAARLISMIWDLESLEDVGELCALLG